MYKNPVLYKSLVVGVIALFIGVGIQPVFALSDSNKNIETGNNEKGRLSGRSFIIIYLTIWISEFIPSHPPTGVFVTCMDLDTGNIRIGITKLGFKFFKFLPLGHDYKITFYWATKTIDKYVFNLNRFSILEVYIS